MHRAVHIFVFNEAGEIYVQRRSEAKDRHPGKLDSSAAGHVDPGESYHETAMRELREEIGIKRTLEEVFRVQASEITDHEHVVLFTIIDRPGSRHLIRMKCSGENSCNPQN